MRAEKFANDVSSEYRRSYQRAENGGVYYILGATSILKLQQETSNGRFYFNAPTHLKKRPLVAMGNQNNNFQVLAFLN